MIYLYRHKVFGRMPTSLLTVRRQQQVLLHNEETIRPTQLLRLPSPTPRRNSTTTETNKSITTTTTIATKNLSTTTTTTTLRMNEIQTEYTVLERYDRTEQGLPSINIVRGSVLDFTVIGLTDTMGGRRVGCIVNAANEACLGGGGVDGAINIAGGTSLINDRLALPIQDRSTQKIYYSKDNFTYDVRCPTGLAVITGPNQYGTIQVPYIIHTVGPNFCKYKMNKFPDDPIYQREVDYGYSLLRSAYHTSLDVASDTSKTTTTTTTTSAAATSDHTTPMAITDIAFCIISAGAYRGKQSLDRIIQHGITAIRDWKPSSSSSSPSSASKSLLSEIYLFAYTEMECDLLIQYGKEILL